MAVARNVWQHVDAGTPAAAARRLIIDSTTRRVSDRPLSRARPVHALKQRRLRVLDPADDQLRIHGGLGPVMGRSVMTLAALLVPPQPSALGVADPSIQRRCHNARETAQTANAARPGAPGRGMASGAIMARPHPANNAGTIQGDAGSGATRYVEQTRVAAGAGARRSARRPLPRCRSPAR